LGTSPSGRGVGAIPGFFLPLGLFSSNYHHIFTIRRVGYRPRAGPRGSRGGTQMLLYQALVHDRHKVERTATTSVHSFVARRIALPDW